MLIPSDSETANRRNMEGFFFFDDAIRSFEIYKEQKYYYT